MATLHDEGKDILIPIAFFDAEGVAVTPVTAHYRLVKGDGTELIPWTSIGSLGATVEVRIGATHNLVAIPSSQESRHFAVKFTYGPSEKVGTAGLEYRLRDLPAYL